MFPLLRGAFLSDEERDLLWARFRVPVQAILLDDRGAVIGYECEMQEGFHLAPGRAPDAFDARLEETACECGRPGLRLMPRKAPERALERGALARVNGAGARLVDHDEPLYSCN